MTQVIIAREAGACYGVERALEMVRNAAATAEGPLHTLGPLIHNPLVVHELEQAGVTPIDDVRHVEPGSTVVLRTHGVTPEVERAAHEAGAQVLDATCPFVKRAHRAAERLEREGYQVVIVGERGHPEVEGTLGHAPHALVVETAEEARQLALSRKVGLVVQTTQSAASLRAVVGELVARVGELRLINTICEATSGHQGACMELAAQADVMVVVGGRNSANTTHLAEIAQSLCPRTHHIEQASELDARWFEGAQTVGITAGASTPARHIEAVRAAIEQLLED